MRLARAAADRSERRRGRKRLFAGLAAALLGLAGVTGWALEAGDVAVLVTERPDGRLRETHVWWAADAGAIWVEAATPERAWLSEALASAEVELIRAGRRERFGVESAPGPGAHARLRALLREKYGLRDAWVGLLQDTSRSVAVLLRPRESGEGIGR
jgi:hypothetical protein